MAIQLSHEGLAETHDLGVALAAGIEVGTTLCAAHGQSGQAVLKGLLKAQKLDDRQVYGRMEAQAALVGADCSVVLYTVAAVYVYLAGVVNPRHTELDGALGLNHSLQQAGLLILGVGIHYGSQRGENLFNGLKKFGFSCVLFSGFFQHSFNIRVHNKDLHKKIFL